MPVPDDLKGIERHAPGNRVAPGRGHAEAHGECRKAQSESPREKKTPGENEESAARPITEQCEADDHESEMMPERNGEQAREQDLVGDSGGGQKRDCREQRHRY